MFSSNTTQESAGYQIQRSLRFNSADSAYLNRTPASAGNRTTWTFSAWVKRSSFSANSALFTCYFADNDNSNFALLFDSSNQLTVGLHTINAFQTTAVYRDPSAWYHVVLAVDTTQATAANRMKLYVNGAQVTAFATNNLSSIAQNTQLAVNTTNSHLIGGMNLVGWFYPGYMTEVNFIDGQALTPSSFGETNPDTGVWQPKRYNGTYGTNGFYLNFSDNSNTTATTLGKDYSGNGNNWTPNNFSVAAGAGNDSLVDVPTPYGVDTGVGGTVRGNYCTWNPLDKNTSISTLNGNLDAYVSSGSWFSVRATFGISSGKWYWEFVKSGSSTLFGIGTQAASLATYVGGDANGWSYFQDGRKFSNDVATSYGASFTDGDIVGVAFDADAGTLTFYKNGVSQGTAFTGITGGTYFPMVGMGNAGTATANFGQRPFAYTAPSGFKALCTQNLPTPTVGATATTQAGKYFNAVTYTGNGTARSITGVGFQPDLVWAKLRDTNSPNGLFDVVRGATKRLRSNTTDAEDTISGVTSFDADGFSLGTSYNGSGFLYVAWNWKANGAGVTNTAGSITSTVSANTTSGFSIVTYTGNGSSGATIGHGLGAAPKMIIVKNRSITSDWFVGHSSIGWTNFLKLNATNASAAASSVWNNTAPSSTVFTIGNDAAINNSGNNLVAYCFAEVPGYSRFGSYTGNGSTDGPFVYCGFRPKYVMVKRTDTGGTNMNWIIWDAVRNTYNVMGEELYANLEDAGATYTDLDFVSNGFKIRNSTTWYNASGATYIFAAFAEAPQKFALAR